MSDQAKKRPQSRELRTSLVDTGWSDVPPAAEQKSTAGPVDTELGEPDQANTHAALAESARELPRYEASVEPGEEEVELGSERAPHEAATKRIAYAALLGGSQAGRGGPSEGPSEAAQRIHEEPTLIAHSPLTEEQAKELAGPVATAEQPLPSFATDAETFAVFEQAAQAFESHGAEMCAAAHPEPAAQEIFDDTDLTVPAAVEIPAEALAGPMRSSTSTLPGVPAATPPALDDDTKAPVASLQPSAEPAPILGLLAALKQPFCLFGLNLPLYFSWLLPAGATCLALLIAMRSDPTPQPAPALELPRSVDQPELGASVSPDSPRPSRQPTLHERAALGQPEALAELSQLPEQSRRAADAVAIAKGRAARELGQLRAYSERLREDEELARGEEARQKLLAYARDPRTAPDALATLSELPGKVGPDLLYELWTGTKKSTDTTQLARELVYKPEVRSRASSALKVALELRSEPRCDQMEPLIARAEQHGDWRSLHLLGRLLQRKGCGPEGADDCYACLRNPAMEHIIIRAIKAVRARPKP